MINTRKWKQIILLLLITFVCICFTNPDKAFAAEGTAEQEAQERLTPMNQIMITLENTEAREASDENTKVVFEYEKDASVFVVGQTDNGWYKVSYQGKEAYILQKMVKAQVVGEALEIELQNMQDESKMVVEEIERYRAESRRSKIWGAVIILLIVGIFATGIISTIKNERENAKGKEESSPEENDEAGINEETPIREVKVKRIQPAKAEVNTVMEGDIEPEDINVIDLDKE